jgi:membrane-associated phospholipid phosphatase
MASNMSWFRCRTCATLCVILVLGCTSAAAQPAAPVPPSIGAVLREIPPDLWHFLSADTGAVLALGGVAAVAGHVWDDDLAQEIETNVALNDAMAPGNTYGQVTVQALFGVGLYTGGWFAKNERLARAGGDIMRAQILGQIYVQAIKYTVQRERPDQSNHHSFPSGHSASAFATAGVLQRHYGWKVGVPATVVAAYVATARVHDNRHYLSDVIFGAAMGIAAQRTVTLHAGRYGVTVAPSAGPRGAGVRAVVHLR